MDHVHFMLPAKGGERFGACKRVGGGNVKAKAFNAHSRHPVAELPGHVVSKEAALSPGNKYPSKLLDVFLRAALSGKAYEKKYVREAYLLLSNL